MTVYRPIEGKVKIDSLAISPARPYSRDAESTESLPFKVRIVASPQDLQKAVEIRSSAYARHVPEVGQALRQAEDDDFRPDVLSIFAERKADGVALGSVRLQPNLNKPLRLEGETTLPVALQRRRLVEFMRLGVENGIPGQMVSAALVKAGFEICHACGFDYILAAGRKSVATIYRGMAFDDVLDGGTIALSYANHLPHGIFSIPVKDVDRRLPARNPALYRFMAQTHHPDISIDYERVFNIFGEP